MGKKVAGFLPSSRESLADLNKTYVVDTESSYRWAGGAG
jgi:hypothetical protein